MELTPLARLADPTGKEIAEASFPRALDTSSPTLPTRIHDLLGRCAEFDPNAKEIVEQRLEQKLAAILRRELSPLPLERASWASPPCIESYLSGAASPNQRFNVVVVDQLPGDVITPHHATAASGLRRLEPAVATPGVVVFFSSPSLAPEHHHRVWDFALRWPDHTALHAGLHDERCLRARARGENVELAPHRAWTYQRLHFLDRAGEEHAAHILTAKERPIAAELQPFVDPAAGAARAREIERLREHLPLGGGLGTASEHGRRARAFARAILRDMAAAFRGERPSTEPLDAYAKRHQLTMPTVTRILTHLPRRIKNELSILAPPTPE